jgi:hypothetical protein
LSVVDQLDGATFVARGRRRENEFSNLLPEPAQQEDIMEDLVMLVDIIRGVMHVVVLVQASRRLMPRKG